MLERVAYWLLPRLRLEGTPFYRGWLEKEQRENIRFWRILFPAVALAYLVRGYLSESHLQHAGYWLGYHRTLTGLCLATAGLYFLRSVCRSRIYRLPAAVTLLAICYINAQTMVLDGKDQYMLAFIVVILATVALRTSVFFGMCFAVLAIDLQWDSLIEAGVSTSVAFSGSVGTLVFAMAGRSEYAGEIRYYLTHQTMMQSQKEMIEMNIEFSDRIRAFLPKEISNRVAEHVNKGALTVDQAVDEVLQPAERQIACLFTDIRGFTKGTKESESFISEGVIPNVVACSRMVENRRGIPSKIGDLLFAYFDDPSINANLVRCLLAACEIVHANSRFNRTNQLQIEIHRYVLVSTGNALVGNLGGSDSSMEITAIGYPVDLLSRMDQLTKKPKFRERVSETDLVLCPHTAELLNRLDSNWDLRRIALADLDASFGDYKEVESLWVFAASEHNRIALLDAESLLEDPQDADSSPLGVDEPRQAFATA